jgi:hypothetical protein
MTLEKIKSDILERFTKIGYSKTQIALIQDVAEVAYLSGKEIVLDEQIKRLEEKI